MMVRDVLFRGALLAATSLLLDCGGTGSPCEIVCGPGTVCDPSLAQCVVTRNPIGNEGQGGFSGAGGGTGAGGATGSTDGLPCDVSRVLQSNCQSCHGTVPALNAPFPLMTRADLLAASPINPAQSIGQRSVMRMQSSQAPMPPAPAPHVGNAELNAFGTWVNLGMPAGSCTTSGAGGGNGDTGSGGGVSGTGGGISGTGGGVSGTGGGVSGTGGGISGAGGGTTGTGGGTSGAGGGSSGGTGGGTATVYCRSCTSNAQCGTTGNFCLDDGSGVTGYCGLKCTSNANCAASATCVSIVDANNVSLGKNCVPTSGVCSGGTGGGAGGGGGTAGGAGGGGTAGGAGGGSASTCTDTWANYASSWFNSYCANCHNSEFATKSAVAGKASSIKSRINSGNMPQNRTLTAAQKAKILNWFTCGMP